MGRLRSFRNEDGSTAVEFGLIAVPFIALVLAALQLAILFLSQEVLETSAEEVGRQILTGHVQKQSLTQAQFHTLVCSSIPALLKCGNVMADVEVASSFSGANTSQPTLTYDANGNVTNPWQFQPGNPGDVVVLRLIYQWPIFNALGFNLINLPSKARLLMATAVFKNESYQ